MFFYVIRSFPICSLWYSVLEEWWGSDFCCQLRCKSNQKRCVEAARFPCHTVMRHLIRRIFRPASVVLYHVLMQLDHLGTVQRTASASHISGVRSRALHAVHFWTTLAFCAVKAQAGTQCFTSRVPFSTYRTTLTICKVYHTVGVAQLQ